MSRRKGAPWAHRPHHRAFARLSAAARRLAIDAFRANLPTTAIVEAIAKQHGETIPVSSLNRYREWWAATERPLLEAETKVTELLATLREHPTPEIEAAIRQLLLAQRLTAMTEERTPEATKLGLLDLEERKLRLKERELAIRERALESKVNRAAKAVEGELKRKKTVDPETIARIKQEVYGIAS